MIFFKNNILFLFFKLHYLGMIIIPFLWLLSPYSLLLHLLTIISWKINNNKCIISQLEYYFTGRTFQGIGKKYYVPKKHRYILYINFLIGLIYYLDFIHDINCLN